MKVSEMTARSALEKLVLVVVLAVIGVPALAAELENRGWLITPAESLLLEQGKPHPSARGERTTEALRLQLSSQDGPTLEVEKPQANLVHSPIDMRIHFVAKSAPVDFQSLEVHAQKWLLGSFRGNLDLSPRVKKFLVADGIDMQNQDLPKGEYRFALSISDVHGVRTEGLLLLDVR